MLAHEIWVLRNLLLTTTICEFNGVSFKNLGAHILSPIRPTKPVFVFPSLSLNFVYMSTKYVSTNMYQWFPLLMWMLDWNFVFDLFIKWMEGGSFNWNWNNNRDRQVERGKRKVQKRWNYERIPIVLWLTKRQSFVKVNNCSHNNCSPRVVLPFKGIPFKLC